MLYLNYIHVHVWHFLPFSVFNCLIESCFSVLLISESVCNKIAVETKSVFTIDPFVIFYVPHVVVLVGSVVKVLLFKNPNGSSKVSHVCHTLLHVSLSHCYSFFFSQGMG